MCFCFSIFGLWKGFPARCPCSTHTPGVPGFSLLGHWFFLWLPAERVRHTRNLLWLSTRPGTFHQLETPETPCCMAYIDAYYTLILILTVQIYIVGWFHSPYMECLGCMGCNAVKQDPDTCETNLIHMNLLLHCLTALLLGAGPNFKWLAFQSNMPLRIHPRSSDDD